MASTPKRIGRYDIAGVLGRGGMGVVYEGRDPNDPNVRVAIKTVTGLRAKYIHAVRVEIRALARLTHPGIVRIVDEGVHEGAPWYAMPFVEGFTLRSYRRALIAQDSSPPTPSMAGFLESAQKSVVLAVDDEGETRTSAGGSGSASGARSASAPALPSTASSSAASSSAAPSSAASAAPGANPASATGSGKDTVKDTGGRSAASAPSNSGASAEVDDEGDTASVVDWAQHSSARPPSTNASQSSSGTGSGARRATGPVSPAALDRVLIVFQRLCFALEYLHGEGLVHRDLKPENIVVGPQMTPVILDLGLAAHALGRGGRESIEDLGSIGAGTAPYMAPEQIKGDLVDGRADLYSLGCVLYEALIGRPPFVSPTSAGVLHLHVSAEPEPIAKELPWLPPAIAELVMALLTKEPRARIGHAGDVARILGDAIAPERRVTPVPAPTARPYIYRPSIVGRASITDKLAERIDHLGDGVGGGALLIAGESGVGKTRIALELGRLAYAQGAFVIAGEATQQRSRPLAPLSRVLQAVGDRCARGGRETTTTILGQRAKLLAAYEPSLVTVPGFELCPDPEPMPAPEARRRLLASLIEMLRVLSDDRPLFVLIDDLQWADELTISFFDEVAAHKGQLSRVLLVGTVRSEEGDEVLDALRDRAELIELGPLDENAVGALLRDALGASSVATEVRDAIFVRSRGNPFYAQEAAHVAVSEGALVRAINGDVGASAAGGAWRVVDLERVPRDRTALIARRLVGLSPEAQRVLEAAAILDNDASYDVIAEVIEQPLSVVMDASAELSRRQIAEPPVDDAVRFIHDKLAEAARAHIADLRRVDLHRGAARVLERKHESDVGAVAAALAEHHERSGDAVSAARWLSVAGDRGRTLYALKEAERHYHRAVSALERLGEVEKAAKTLLKLALVHTASFQGPAARTAYERAFSLLDELRASRPHTAVETPARVAIAIGDPSTIDPALAFDSDSLFVLGQLFEGLVEIDSELNVLPAAASSWSVSDDGCRYTFTLRSDVRWSDGTPVTAPDFALAWLRVLHPRTESPSAALLFAIENARAFHAGVAEAGMVGIRAHDARTLSVKLASPSAFFPYVLVHPATYPVPSHAMGRQPSRVVDAASAVTNGPFVVERVDERSRLILKRSPTYRGLFPGNATEIECAMFSHYPDALAAYASGEIDVLDLIAADLDVIAEARRRFPNQIRFEPLHSTHYVALRIDRAPLDDVRVRKALALAIDRNALAQQLSGAPHVVARGGFVPPTLPGHSTTLALPYDPERAIALLNEAGYARPELVPAITWIHTHGIGDATLLKLVHDQWRRFGLHVEIAELPWSQYQRALRDVSFHATLGAWIADYPEPDSFMRGIFHSRDGAEATGWRHEPFDHLVDTAARSTDTQERLDNYRVADHIVVAEQVVGVPLTYGRGPILCRPRVLEMPAASTYLRALKSVIVGDAQ
jgi:ABC-type oligopeptide transport system substrate-binding subunit/serine/threonine protein kinase